MSHHCIYCAATWRNKTGVCTRFVYDPELSTVQITPTPRCHRARLHRLTDAIVVVVESVSLSEMLTQTAEAVAAAANSLRHRTFHHDFLGLCFSPVHIHTCTNRSFPSSTIRHWIDLLVSLSLSFRQTVDRCITSPITLSNSVLLVFTDAKFTQETVITDIIKIKMRLKIIKPPLAIARGLSASELSICLSVCLSPKCKNAIFSKTKQFRAMVSIDDI